jgi:2-methylcitrate dehydratase PrpD
MYPMAVTLSRGHFQLKDLSIENVLDSTVARLMKKIKMITSDFWTPEAVKKYPEGATVSVLLKTGELLVEFLGSPQASTAQKKLILQRKIPECFEGFVEKEEQARFTEMISKLETFNSTAEILPRTHDAM